MKSVLITAVFSFLVITGYSQGSAVTTAVLAMGSEEYEKAKNSIDAAVLHEKTKTDPKAWYNRGIIYQKLAEIKIGQYVFLATNKISEEQIETFKGLSEDPSAVSLESYKKCLEYDVKKRYIRKVDAQLDALGITIYNEGGTSYSKAFGGGGDEANTEAMMQAYHSYERMFDLMETMSEIAAESFKGKLVNNAGLDPELNEVRFNMANAAFYAKSYDKAQKEYEYLVEAKMEELIIYRNLSDIYKRQNDLEAQKRLWTKGRENFPKNTAIALDEAVFYQEIGEVDILVEKLENAIALDPKNASLYNVLGGIYTQRIVDHNNALSDEEVDQSKKMSPEEYTEAKSKAEAHLLKAQELDPKEPTNFTQLGSLYLSEGLVSYNANQNLSTKELSKGKALTEKYKAAFAKAKTQYEKGLEVEPNNEIAKEYLNKIGLWMN